MKKLFTYLFGILALSGIISGIIILTFNKLELVRPTNSNINSSVKSSAKLSSNYSAKSSYTTVSSTLNSSSTSKGIAKPQADSANKEINVSHTPASTIQAQLNLPLDPKQPKTVYLTFDDGPSTIITNQVLDVLAKYRVHATFFVVGNQINAKTAPILSRIHREGHGIGIHSFDHTYNFEKAGDVKQTALEYQNTLAAIRNVLGKSFTTTAWRYPGGHMSWSKTLSGPDNYLKQNNLTWIDWNAAVGDALGAKSPKDVKGQLDYLNQTLLSYGPHNTTVVLLHDSNSHQLTLQSLPKVIEYFAQKNYKFGTIQ